jgi:hypothetical protein
MKIIIILSLLVSCSHMVRTDGGSTKLHISEFQKMSPEEMPTFAQLTVKKESRDPDGVSLNEIKKDPTGKIKRIGVILFESEIQPSRSGLASERNVYLSVRGKQILTEFFANKFNFDLMRLSNPFGVEWVSTHELQNSKAYRSYGSIYPDYILRSSDSLTAADAFWKSGGERIPETTLVLPHNAQDTSILLVPSYELMSGPKPSQHQHHWINDICKELGLDAVVVASLEASWQRAGVDKRTKVVRNEEMNLSFKASLIYPWSTHHQILEKKNKATFYKSNIPLAAYSIDHIEPIVLSVESSQETFETAEKNIFNVLDTNMGALIHLVSQRIVSDIIQTHQVE